MSEAPARRGPLPIADVVVDDAFWSPRRETVRTRALPHQEHQLRTGGQFEALKLAWRPGDEREPHIFWESDVAKWIEAASYTLARGHDPDLDASVDEAIALLEGAQGPDGYLNVHFTVVRPGERFTDLRDAHELYCAGHLIEAGVAHHAATGKTRLLDLVRRLADLVDREFGPGGSCEGGYDGHPEIELALVKLYRATGERRYLDLSLRLVDSRGRDPHYFAAERDRRGTEGFFGPHFLDRPTRPEWYREYVQDHAPVREQSEAVGHAVRAVYLYAGMADLALETGDAALRAACERLWDDVVSTKLYLTGGIGADPSREAFGPAYHLPVTDGYAETCAAIGLVMWARRMGALTGEAKYADVLERALYNGVVSGASADGTRYFYPNPLASDGTVERSEWFDCACCPPNYARLVASLEEYAYTADPDGLAVELYVSGSARFDRDGASVRVSQSTEYPWDGRVALTVDTETPVAFALRLRLPDWAPSHTLTVGGEPFEAPLESGYLVLDRTWAPGTEVVLDLPMAPTRVHAAPAVAAVHGRTAIQRGPIVYCAEEIDNAGPVPDLAVDPHAALRAVPDPDLGVVRVDVDGVRERPIDSLYSTERPAAEPTVIRTVPYYSWANRGKGTMAVWLRESAR
ncbi:glycoside hydrolase family 127 protein [Glycomyces paridis]|uniref:Glycoside hydrolase family 127 protein n=1 Tax=Glycomyces paridis TaxID=2126555 RepID=A0A4S8PM57_9ACTN|nr:beta-L-arabinofuranosidase domain-containing protein [Glycomyces paridis]THV30825.1 glycoside hydrolase family 127 protein [Glycomyces paridis]